MTARRRRRIRPEPEGYVPEEILAWFAGEEPMPWTALLEGFELVPAWWRAWCESHPGATPPADAAGLWAFEDVATR